MTSKQLFTHFVEILKTTNMKNFTTTLILFLSIGSIIGQVSDSVFLQSGYTNQSYYHLDNGEVTNVDNTNWDLATIMEEFRHGYLS